MAGETTPDNVGKTTLERLAQAPAINDWLYEKLRPSVHGNVLEIGSGIGNLSRLIVRDARRAVLTEYEPAYLEALRHSFAGQEKVRVVPWNVTEPPPTALTADGARFDAIVAVNVIEHLQDDLAAVRALAALLRPGGRLLVYVPACPWAFGSLDVALGHHRRYTSDTLRGLLRQAGLRVPPPLYMNRLGLVGWTINARVLKKKALSGRAIGLFNAVVLAARLLDRLLAPLPAGLGVVAHAQKP